MQAHDGTSLANLTGYKDESRGTILEYSSTLRTSGSQGCAVLNYQGRFQRFQVQVQRVQVRVLLVQVRALRLQVRGLRFQVRGLRFQVPHPDTGCRSGWARVRSEAWHWWHWWRRVSGARSRRTDATGPRESCTGTILAPGILHGHPAPQALAPLRLPLHAHHYRIITNLPARALPPR